MPHQSKKNERPSTNLHPRNKHQGRYDFEQLIVGHEALKAFVVKNKFGKDSINFLKQRP